MAESTDMPDPEAISDTASITGPDAVPGDASTSAEAAPRFGWSGRYELQHAEMDGIHQEFVLLVDALLHAPDEEVAGRLDALMAHTRHHFERETTWMQLSAFPPIHCHEREHAKVVEVAATVRERVAAGEYELGRTLAAGLVEWFEIHADTMDRVLAIWMTQRRLDDDGGAAA